jgi:uncharacterized protein (TIGR02145 family)
MTLSNINHYSNKKHGLFLRHLTLLFLGFVISCQEEEIEKKIPQVSTNIVQSIDETMAIGGGEIIFDGNDEIITKGVCWSKEQNPTIQDNKTVIISEGKIFVSEITGLNFNTSYFVRAYATNSIGTGYGNQQTFKTLTSIPIVETVSASKISSYSALVGGQIIDNGGNPIIEKGICWIIVPYLPTIKDNVSIDSSGVEIFKISIDGLLPGTNYNVRAYAKNTKGISYGNQITFKTSLSPKVFNTELNYGMMSDIEGNIYKTIKIGNQVWMAENLKTTKYKNGANIRYCGNWYNWWDSVHNWEGALYTKYENNDEISEIYGYLYSYAAIGRGLAPEGWHIPSDNEWFELINYLGGEGNAGQMAKEVGLAHWLNPNLGANNISGFTGIPGGMFKQTYLGMGILSAWWSAGHQRHYFILYNNRIDFQRFGTDYQGKDAGLSVRCIKNSTN